MSYVASMPPRARPSVVPSVPSCVVLVFALLGQVKEQFALVALVGGVALALWASLLALATAVQLARRAPVVSLLAGLATSGVALFAVAALVGYAPLWVQWRAAPAIDAIERTRVENGRYPDSGSLDGDFPSLLRAALEANGHCVYKPRSGSYHLACLGVPYARCGYDGATKRWSGWE